MQRQATATPDAGNRRPFQNDRGTGFAGPLVVPPARGWARHAVRNLGVSQSHAR